jgi:hypothetical protein
MSLDVTLTAVRPTKVFTWNITHNLNVMAMAADLYMPIWRPEELDITLAEELIKPLTEGLKRLESTPGYFRTFNPANGWGTYENLVEFVQRYLKACKEDPDAIIEVSR